MEYKTQNINIFNIPLSPLILHNFIRLKIIIILKSITKNTYTQNRYVEKVCKK